MPGSEKDIITPLQLYHEIEAAQSIEVLRELGIKMLDTVRCIITVPVDAKSIVQMIARVNSAITRRLIALMEAVEGISLPDGAAYLALGSEGRGEQTLRTDQDSAIVYPDGLSSEKLIEVNRFATRLVDALEAIGVPRCPGNVMASNPQWCHSVSEWKRLLEEWITVPTHENILDFCLFQDLSSLHGDESLCTELRDHIRTTVWLPPFFFPNLACHATRFPSPLTFIGRIRVERRGEHRGKVDIKKSGIFAITVGASLLALEAGVVGGNTWDKLSLLGQRRIVTVGDLKKIEAAFSFLVRLRIQSQLRELAADNIPTNYVDPQLMTDKERYQFRQALKGVSNFLRIMNNRYQLNYISH
jgi:CBS domain-containing protein